MRSFPIRPLVAKLEKSVLGRNVFVVLFFLLYSWAVSPSQHSHTSSMWVHIEERGFNFNRYFKGRLTAKQSGRADPIHLLSFILVYIKSFSNVKYKTPEGLFTFEKNIMYLWGIIINSKCEQQKPYNSHHSARTKDKDKISFYGQWTEAWIRRGHCFSHGVFDSLDS